MFINYEDESYRKHKKALQKAFDEWNTNPKYKKARERVAKKKPYKWYSE